VHGHELNAGCVVELSRKEEVSTTDSLLLVDFDLLWFVASSTSAVHDARAVESVA